MNDGSTAIAHGGQMNSEAEVMRFWAFAGMFIVIFASANFLTLAPALAAELPGPTIHDDRLSLDNEVEYSDPLAAFEEAGIKIGFDWTQHLQGIVSGGSRDAVAWGSRFDTNLTFDGEQLGLWSGLFLDVQVQARLGRTINSDAGTVLPVNFDLSFPALDKSRVAVPLFRMRQQVNDELLLFFGRITPLPGYTNAFAAGLGKSQFSNTAFVAKPVMSGVVSASAYTAGFSYQLAKPDGPLDRGAAFKLIVQDANDTYSALGFDTLFDNGYAALAELFVSTTIFGLPGQQTVNFAWSNKTRSSLDLNDAVILPGEGQGLVPGDKDFTWALFYGFDQYIWVDPDNQNRNFGVFGQFSISDANPNPIHWFFNIGFGGTGLFEQRSADKWGIGYFQTEFSDTLQASLIDVLDLQLGAERGIEAFYSFSLRENLDLTFDLQHVEPAIASNLSDWVTIGGLRLRAQF